MEEKAVVTSDVSVTPPVVPVEGSTPGPELEEALDSLLDFETEEEGQTRKDKEDAEEKKEDETNKGEENKDDGKSTGTEKEPGEAGGDSKDGEQKDSGGVKEPKHLPKSVPYPRFSEVVQQRNALRQQLEQRQAQQPPVAQQQQQSARVEGADVKQKEPDVLENLSAEQLQYIKANHPDLYETVLAKQIAAQTKKEVLKALRDEQTATEQQRETEGYVQHFAGRIGTEFQDVAKTDSDWYKNAKPIMSSLAKEYPKILDDPAMTHLSLRYADALLELNSLREKVKKEVKDEMGKNRAEKRSAALAGQARHPGSVDKEDDPWGGPPKWLKNK